MVLTEKHNALIQSSKYISRDLSWIQFNYRVLDQVKDENRSVFERMRFIAITASNLDEFFMIRVGSLYNYLDFKKSRFDYSGLREDLYKIKIFEELQAFVKAQNECYEQYVVPFFVENGFNIVPFEELKEEEKNEIAQYFERVIFPMLTPMVFDQYHVFPILLNQLLIFSVLTKDEQEETRKKLSFVQIPSTLPRFYVVERPDIDLFVPIESIIRNFIDKLFRNVQVLSTSLFRITRNGDFSVEETEDVETEFVNEIKRKLKTRQTGRVVRVEVEQNFPDEVRDILMKRFNIDKDNFFYIQRRLNLKDLMQIVKHEGFQNQQAMPKNPVLPLALVNEEEDDIFEVIKKKDILLHHPYNSMDVFLELLEKASEDPDVLSIKITIYRLAKESRVTNALLKAAENGKQVSALFELKARFDEENNIRESKRLQEAGCFVIHGVGSYKAHTKMCLIVRKEGDGVRRYVHLSSGNYNESTAKTYTDIALLTAKEEYAQDVSEFFNAITGHSHPYRYKVLITAPRDLRNQLIELIDSEAKYAQQGLPSGIVIKINSLQDDKFMDALYRASQAGVPIHLIVRGICCLRPERAGLSDNITVRSIVGDYLEHGRLFYFHQNGQPKVYGGSADAMVRSFDKRIESLFLITDEQCKQEAINILAYSLRDNVNAYKMNQDGTYTRIKAKKGEERFNV
ncbi:MAG: polyphosphate kinase 1, partial [Flammeovirgaceae bacterium]|nr:polyphosphate kinase 1 [Flammeovirgaceae bacterium]MDW8287986.1 polyphosphate kinase 1 [Flammeovirgaceae bacterium]